MASRYCNCPEAPSDNNRSSWQKQSIDNDYSFKSQFESSNINNKWMNKHKTNEEISK